MRIRGGPATVIGVNGGLISHCFSFGKREGAAGRFAVSQETDPRFSNTQFGPRRSRGVSDRFVVSSACGETWPRESRPALSMKESVLFMGHGSRDAEAVDECMSMVSDLERRLGQPFTPGFLELSKPLLFPELVRQIDQGVRRFLCFPNMLLPGRHTMEHLPGVIGWAQRHFPDVEFYYGNFIGNHPLIYDMLNHHRRQALERSTAPPGSGRTVTVVVGRGSRSERSNRTFEKIVRRFGQRYEVRDLRFGYVSLAQPNVEDVLRDLMQEVGVGRVVMLPYFLFTGVLVKRIRDLRDRFQKRYPSVEFVLADYFGRNERLQDILRGRIQELIERPRRYRSNDFRAISEQAAHHLHHLDVFGDEPAAQYLQEIPDCPEHRHPSRRMEDYEHLHQEADHTRS